MTDPDRKSWVVRCQYDGRMPFWAGSFLVPAALADDEAKFKAAKMARAFLDSINHEWLSLPTILEIREGTMLLIMEDEDESDGS